MTLFEHEISPLALNTAGEPLQEVNCLYRICEHTDDLIIYGTESSRAGKKKKDFRKDVLQNNN